METIRFYSLIKVISDEVYEYVETAIASFIIQCAADVQVEVSAKPYIMKPFIHDYWAIRHSAIIIFSVRAVMYASLKGSFWGIYSVTTVEMIIIN